MGVTPTPQSNTPYRRDLTVEEITADRDGWRTRAQHVEATLLDENNRHRARIAALEEALRQFPSGLIQDGPRPKTGLPTRYLMVRADDYKRWRDAADALLSQNTASAEVKNG